MERTTKKTTLLKKAAQIAMKGNANSTSCGMVYQPKAPAALKAYSKLNNDK